MKRFKSVKSKLMLGALLLLIGLPFIAFSATFQRFTVRDNQIYLLSDDGSVTLAGDLSAVDLVISDDATLTDQVIRRSATVSHSTSISTGDTYPCLLMGSTDTIIGHLLVAFNAGAGTSEGCVVTVANNIIDQTTWIGIAANAISTGSVVQVYTSGFVLARTTGTVVEGDTLVSTDNASSTPNSPDGHLEADTTPTTGADVGVALEDGDAGGGLTLIRLR